MSAKKSKAKTEIDMKVFENLYEAGMRMRSLISASDDRSDLFDPYQRGLSRADRLRAEADKIEAQDAAILNFRRALKAAHEALGKSSEGIDWQINRSEILDRLGKHEK